MSDIVSHINPNGEQKSTVQRTWGEKAGMNYIGKEYNQKPSLSNSTPIQELYSIRERIKHYPQWQSCRRSVLFIMPAFKNGHFLNIQSFFFSEVIHVSLHINGNKYFKMNYTWKGLHLAYINQQDDYGGFFFIVVQLFWREGW